MAITNHVLADYYINVMNDIREKVSAIAQAMGITAYIPVPVAMQVDIDNFRPGVSDEGVNYISAKKTLPPFPAGCFGGFVGVEQNFNLFTQIDPDTYEPLTVPERVPVSHPLLTRADIFIWDNGYAMVDSVRTSCPNIHKIGKPYKELPLPVWLRPTPADEDQATKTELSTDPEAADPPGEAISRSYDLEVVITEQAFEDATPLRDVNQFVINNISKIKVDETINGFLLVSPTCRSKLFGPTGFSVPVEPCEIKDTLAKTIKYLY